MSGNGEPRVVDAEPLRYLLSLPDGGGGGPHPVLCFLHGYDEAAPADIRQALTLHGPLRPGNPPISRGFIVVAPQLARAGDHWIRHADDVARIVAEVREAHGG